ncbi:MAG: GNAT family protein [Arachidicoccus sp.]|nr:GNAT family protein [Arachidicoccus sp.]
MRTNQKINVNENILLKQINVSDAKDIFNLIDSQRSYLRKWLPFIDGTKQIKDTEDYIYTVEKETLNNKELVFVIFYKNKLAGTIGMKRADWVTRTTEIGYWLSEDFQKKGIITQSVKALMRFAFDELKLNTVIIKCGVGNLPSKNIPMRLKFNFIGIEKKTELSSDGEYIDLEVYSFSKKINS